MLIEHIDNVRISGDIIGMHPDELKQYVERGKSQYPDLTSIWLKIVGDEVELRYFGPGGTQVPMDRIRRITGYLSLVKNFNNGKAAELSDRVTHE